MKHIWHAIAGDNVEEVSNICASESQVINQIIGGYNMLMFAAYTGSINTFKFLIEKIDPLLVNNEGVNVMYYAYLVDDKYASDEQIRNKMYIVLYLHENKVPVLRLPKKENSIRRYKSIPEQISNTDQEGITASPSYDFGMPQSRSQPYRAQPAFMPYAELPSTQTGIIASPSFDVGMSQSPPQPYQTQPAFMPYEEQPSTLAERLHFESVMSLINDRELPLQRRLQMFEGLIASMGKTKPALSVSKTSASQNDQGNASPRTNSEAEILARKQVKGRRQRGKGHNVAGTTPDSSPQLAQATQAFFKTPSPNGHPNPQQSVKKVAAYNSGSPK